MYWCAQVHKKIQRQALCAFLLDQAEPEGIGTPLSTSEPVLQCSDHWSVTRINFIGDDVVRLTATQYVESLMENCTNTLNIIIRTLAKKC